MSTTSWRAPSGSSASIQTLSLATTIPPQSPRRMTTTKRVTTRTTTRTTNKSRCSPKPTALIGRPARRAIKATALPTTWTPICAPRLMWLLCPLTQTRSPTPSPLTRASIRGQWVGSSTLTSSKRYSPYGFFLTSKYHVDDLLKVVKAHHCTALYNS